MAETIKKLAQGQLGTSDAALFTGTAGHVYTISQLVLCNTDNADHVIRIHAVDAAGSSTAANALLYDATIPQNSTWPGADYRGIVLTGAEMIRGSCPAAAAKVTFSLFGVDES